MDFWSKYDGTSAGIEIIVMMLVAFILGYILRRFIDMKYRQRVSELEGELAAASAEAADRSADSQPLGVSGALDSSGVEQKLREAEEENAKLREEVTHMQRAVAASSSGFSVGLGGKDDLKLIEGIGPKIAELLEKSGIDSFAELANTSVDKLKAILDQAGDKFRIHDPSSWPKQAAMAANGDWDKLRKVQDELKGGKGEVEYDAQGIMAGIPSSASGTMQGRIQELEAQLKAKDDELEKMKNSVAGAAAGFSIPTGKPDDLKVIEGIGPKIEKLLHDGGIQSFAKLAESQSETLKAILTQAGDRYRIHDPSTWPKQAALAQKGDWDALKQLQDDLKGGRDR